MATGVLAVAWVGGEGKSGLIDGNPHQVLVQLYGITVTVVYDVVVSLILLKLVDLTVGLRVDARRFRRALLGRDGQTLSRGDERHDRQAAQDPAAPCAGCARDGVRTRRRRGTFLGKRR